MPEPNMVILYVDDPTISATFYRDLFGQPPVEASPTFAMFALRSGFMLGLWARHTVEPAVRALGECGEVAFPVANADAMRATHADWSARGMPVIQAPIEMDFGHTFVALDPDGHRLRVFAPGAQ